MSGRARGDLEAASLRAARGLLDGPGAPGDPDADAATGTRTEVDGICDRLRPHFDSLGITRVGDLTGLDCVGIPVWFACRPNSRSLSVAQGKGMDHGRARMSALGEAIEQAYAERAEHCVTRFGSWREMRQAGLAVAPLDRLLRCVVERFDPERERAWVPGISLRSGAEVFAPYELVGLDFRTAAPWDRDAFRMSSIGLGAGVTLAQAALHALLELIENAAVAPLEMFGMTHDSLVAPLAHAAGMSPRLDDAVGRVQAAGLQLGFVGIAASVDVPVIGAWIDHDVQRVDGGSGLRRCAGFACRLDPDEAALAALLEAVQSRLTNIAGARDDILPEDYAQGSGRARAPSPPALGIHDFKRATPVRPDSADALDRALAAAHLAGAEDVTLFPINAEAIGFHVVRVLVPGLEAGGPGGLVTLGSTTLKRLVDPSGTGA